MDEPDILTRALKPLKELGLNVGRKRVSGSRKDVDGCVVIGRGDNRYDYVVEAKRVITPATLGSTAIEACRIEARFNRKALIVTEYVTAPMAQQLRQMGLQFADAAGNVYLDRPEFMVFVTGRRPEAPSIPRRPAQIFGIAAIKLAFVLLCDPPAAAKPFRQLAALAGISLGAVPRVVESLREAGHLAVSGRSRRLLPSRRLLDQWAQAYAQSLRPKTLLGTYTGPGLATWKDWSLETHGARWGGEPAANTLVGYLKPGVLTIYAEKVHARLIVEQRLMAARTHASHGVLEVRRPFWGKNLDAAVGTATVSPVLVYADLLATGDARCIETAEKVYEAHLARSFPNR
jgi:hypothetical protein